MKGAVVSLLLLSAAALGYTGQAQVPAEQPAASASVSTPSVPTGPATVSTYKAPDTAILGPLKPVSFGRLVALSVKPLTNKPDDLYSVTYVWRVTPNVDDIVAWPDNTRIWFGTGIENVTYKVELIASYVFAKKTGDLFGGPVNQIATTDCTVQVQGNAPPAPPNPPNPNPNPPNPNPNPPNPNPPNPNPPTPPPLPDGKYKLAQDAYNWAVDPQLVKVQPMVRKANAKALADSFNATSKQITAAIAAIAAGTVPDIKNATDALAACKAANNAAVTDAKVTWIGWFTNLDAKLKGLKLQNLDELRDAFAELAIGLEAASLY